MHFRCGLRCVCAMAHLSSPSMYLERYAVLKFGLVFDLNFFHKFDLYPDNTTMLNLHSQCFPYSLYLLPLSPLRKQNLSS